MYIVENRHVTEISAPTDPVSLATCKAHLRVTHSSDDTPITALISAATRYVEQYTGRAYALRSFRADLAGFADTILLPNTPILDITSVQYWDQESPSVQQVLAATNYSLVNNVLSRAWGSTWPDVYPRLDAVAITYRSGYLTSDSPQVDNTPPGIAHAIMMICGDLYENREGQNMPLQVNPTVKMLLDPFRVYR